MPKYKITIEVIIEADNRLDAWDKGRDIAQTVTDKYGKAYV